MAQAYVILVFIFTSLPHPKHRDLIEVLFNVILNDIYSWAVFQYILVLNPTAYIYQNTAINYNSATYMVYGKHIFSFSHSWWMLSMNKSLILWVIFPYQKKCKTNLEYYISSMGISWFFLSLNFDLILPSGGLPAIGREMLKTEISIKSWAVLQAFW